MLATITLATDNGLLGTWIGSPLDGATMAAAVDGLGDFVATHFAISGEMSGIRAARTFFVFGVLLILEGVTSWWSWGRGGRGGGGTVVVGAARSSSGRQSSPAVGWSRRDGRRRRRGRGRGRGGDVDADLRPWPSSRRDP